MKLTPGKTEVMLVEKGQNVKFLGFSGVEMGIQGTEVVYSHVGQKQKPKSQVHNPCNTFYQDQLNDT